MSVVAWEEGGLGREAGWLDAYGAPPRRLVIADDTMSADAAYRAATQGAALLWRGDYHNGRQLLQALGRRIDAGAGTGKRAGASGGRRAGGAPARETFADRTPAGGAAAGAESRDERASLDADAFNQHRMRQSQRSQILNRVLVELTRPEADIRDGNRLAKGRPGTDGPEGDGEVHSDSAAHGYSLKLRRAPDIDQACRAALGRASTPLLVPLRALLGFIGAWEWRQRGVAVPGLDGRIHVHYGVFSPNRGEYLDLVAQAPLPADSSLAFDIGTGSGVLAAMLAARGINKVVATDQDDRALACASENLARLGIQSRVSVIKADLFPPGRSPLVVCNPPWLPARPTTSIENALYDPDSRMLTGFLQGLPAHLTQDGEGWLIMSDLAEHLGLRKRDFIPQAIAAAGLRVTGKMDIKPRHSKALDKTDPLHEARRAETTSLWRLGIAGEVS